MKVHRFVVTLVCGLAFLGFVGGLQAQEKFPSRPVELTVVMAPGGVADLSARIYSDELNKLLNVPVTVVNRAGGGGTLGTAYAARARKDGYTLVQVNEGPILTMPIISKEVTYDPLKDLTPLVHFVTMPSFIAVRSDSPFKTLDDLVAYAKQNPGKLRNSTGPLWTSSHVGLEIFCTTTNIKIVTIPYGSGGEAVAALLGGNLDLVSLVPSAVAPHIKAGKVRALAFTP
jgi:tripartite-type tricarboxylate transporter receptor subunit TctC